MHDTAGDFASRAVQDWASIASGLDIDDDVLVAAIRLSRTAHYQDLVDLRTLRNFEDEGIRGVDDFRSIALLRRSTNGLTNSELLNQLGGSKAGVSKRLDRFGEFGITERVASTTDRRSHTNVLTEHGLALGDRVVHAVVAARQAFFTNLTSDEIKTLSSLLATIIKTIEPKD